MALVDYDTEKNKITKVYDDRESVLIHKGNKPHDIRCPNGHKVAEKKGGKVEIKCKSCKCKVEV